MGLPVGITASPTLSPVVSSYTCITVLPFSIPMTSPTSLFISYIDHFLHEKSLESATVTTGPLMLCIRFSILFTLSFADNESGIFFEPFGFRGKSCIKRVVSGQLAVTRHNLDAAELYRVVTYRIKINAGCF